MNTGIVPAQMGRDYTIARQKHKRQMDRYESI